MFSVRVTDAITVAMATRRATSVYTRNKRNVRVPSSTQTSLFIISADLWDHRYIYNIYNIHHMYIYVRDLFMWHQLFSAQNTV